MNANLPDAYSPKGLLSIDHAKSLLPESGILKSYSSLIDDKVLNLQLLLPSLVENATGYYHKPFPSSYAKDLPFYANDNNSLGEMPNAVIKSGLEKLLSDRFFELVADISVTSTAISLPGRTIANIDDYRLVPMSSSAEPNEWSSVHGGYLEQIEDGVSLTYPSIQGRPFLDSLFAIGLVYRDHLIAVGGAIVTQSNELLIRQLQDVTGVRKNPDSNNYYKTGLHNGMEWRLTLIKVWEEIGERLGADDILVQSARNSIWPTVIKSGYTSYDGSAKSLGYKYDPASGNWRKGSKVGASV